METIGIIAGNGVFPIQILEKAKQKKYRVVVAGILQEASPALKDKSDAFEWIKIGQLKKLKDFFKKHQASNVVMAGKIEKVRLFQGNVQPDFEMLKVLMKLKDYKDDSLLGAIADYLESQKIHLLDSTAFIKDEMPGKGVFGKIKPSKEILDDISFGFTMAKAIAGLDIGQTVVVKKRAVMAVEAIEGTDLAIQRGAELGNEGIVVVKVSKPNQDMRFDVPAIGLETMRNLIRVKASAIAFEAHKTIFFDRERVLQEADEHKIVVYGAGE
jgi:DUF1009 family protein